MSTLIRLRKYVCFHQDKFVFSLSDIKYVISSGEICIFVNHQVNINICVCVCACMHVFERLCLHGVCFLYLCCSACYTLYLNTYLFDKYTSPGKRSNILINIWSFYVFLRGERTLLLCCGFFACFLICVI
jgi:hypothetical protein